MAGIDGSQDFQTQGLAVALAGSGAAAVGPDAYTPKAFCFSALLLAIKTMPLYHIETCFVI